MSLCLSAAATMKFVLTLFAVLAVIGLGQSRPEFDNSPYIKTRKLTPVEKELMNFIELIPVTKVAEIVMKYVTEDKKVRNAVLFLLTPEFHTLLREVEALKEHQAIVIFLEEAELPVSDYIQEFHKAIGMEDYVPPKRENNLESLVGTQKIGEGFKGLIKDIYNILPIDKIVALYKEKLRNSKVFADFVGKITSPKAEKLVKNLLENQTSKNCITKLKEKGWELQEGTKFVSRVFGIIFPY